MKNSTIRIFLVILFLSIMAITISGCLSSDPSPEVQAYHDRIAELEYELDLEYQRGLDHGYENGYSDGYKDGYSDGESYGYDGGFMDGVESGYEDGYSDCSTNKLDSLSAMEKYKFLYRNGFLDGFVHGIDPDTKPSGSIGNVKTFEGEYETIRYVDEYLKDYDISSDLFEFSQMSKFK